MTYSLKNIHKNPLLALSLLALISNSCGKSSHKDKEPPLPTETFAISGGVGVSNSLIIAGPGAQLKQGEGDNVLRLEGDADLAEIRVHDTHYLKVESNACADAVCTIRYTQTELAPETQPISLTLRIRNAAGSEWKEIQASVLGEVPSVAKLPSFTPQYKQKVELDVPVAPGDKINITDVTGGKVDENLCVDGLCKIAMTFELFLVKPTVSFTVSDNIRKSKTYTIEPEAEVFTILKKTANVFDGVTNLTFVPGVDYQSSWNRPVHAIKVKGTQGVNGGPVICDVNVCTVSVTLAAPSAAWSFDYALQSFGNESSVAKLILNKINPEFRGRLTEAPIEFGQENVITLHPGQDYDASDGTLPTNISVQNAWSSDIAISKNTCNAQGVCSFHVTYKGKAEFYSLNYVFERGSYRSPAFPLRLTPWLSVADGDHKVWKKSDQEWHELVLQSAKNYQSADGQLATSVVVTDVRNLKFKDVLDFKSAAESLFTCDSNGTCRALVRKDKEDSWQTNITYRLRSANHVSPLVTRSVVIAGDYPEMITNAKDVAYRPATLKDPGNFLHEFSTTFVYGTDYKSQFPASHLALTVDDENSISIDDAVKVGKELIVSCDVAGTCRLSGNFVNKSFFTRVKVAFRNAYSADNYGNHVYLIEASRAGIFPNQSNYKKIDVKQGVATIPFEKGPGLGYVGDQLAKTIRIRVIDNLRFENVTEGQDASGKYFEFPCDETGRCVVQGKLTGIYPTISYYFVGANGQASVELAVTVSQPETFAEELKQTVAIQSSIVDLNFHSLSGSHDYTIEFFTNDGTVLGSVECEFNDCIGAVKMQTPFNRLKEILVLNYHRKADGKVISDVGTFTLTGGKTYRMKGMEKTAKKDDERTHTFTISMGDIEALGDSPVLMPLGNSMKLKFNVNGIVVSQRECEAEVCTVTLVNVPTSATKVKVEVSQAPGRFDGAFFQTSSFDLIVNP